VLLVTIRLACSRQLTWGGVSAQSGKLEAKRAAKAEKAAQRRHARSAACAPAAQVASAAQPVAGEESPSLVFLQPARSVILTLRTHSLFHQANAPS
jgi:hypothetical protein